MACIMECSEFMQFHRATLSDVNQVEMRPQLLCVIKYMRKMLVSRFPVIRWNPSKWQPDYILSNFEIRCDVTSGRLQTSLPLSTKRTEPCLDIPYTTCMFYGNSPEIYNLVYVSDTTSNLEVEHIVNHHFPPNPGTEFWKMQVSCKSLSSRFLGEFSASNWNVDYYLDFSKFRWVINCSVI